MMVLHIAGHAVTLLLYLSISAIWYYYIHVVFDQLLVFHFIFRYWDTRKPNPVHTQQLPDRCYALTVKYPLMVVGTADRNLIVFNLQNPQVMLAFHSIYRFRFYTISKSPWRHFHIRHHSLQHLHLVLTHHFYLV